MRLKSFYAKTMTEAMQMVRDTLGEDAIIVASREERGGQSVHVTAAIEPHFEISSDGLAAESESWLQYDSEEDESLIAEELTDVMLRHAVPEDVMDNILSCATVVGLENPAIALVAAIEHLFKFKPMPTKAAPKPLMFVGAPGSGKTLAAAKAATCAVMNGLKVGVVSCDTVRAGGVEQLEAFTKLLKVPLQKADSFRELRYIAEDMSDFDQIIIDTAGTNPFDTNDIKILARLIGAIDIEPYLVLASGGDADEAGEIARIFSTVGVHNLIATRTDVARRHGSLLSAAHQGDLTFSAFGNTPKVAQKFIPFSPQSLSGLFIPSLNKMGATTARPRRNAGTTQ